MSEYTVAITLVNYNTRALSLYCLKKIYQANIQVPFQIIFLDNNSVDGKETILDVKEQFPKVITIAESTNTGYTKGVNTCVSRSQAKYIFNLNSDALLEPGSVEKMVEYLEEHPDIGMLAPQLLNVDGSIQESCYRFITPRIALYRRTPLGKLPHAQRELEYFRMKEADFRQTQDVDWALGAAMMFPKNVSEEVNHLDEDMFLYLSDTHFCWKLWYNGYRVVYFPQVQLYHYHRQSSRQQSLLSKILFNRAYRLHIRDGLTYFRKVQGNYTPRSQN